MSSPKYGIFTESEFFNTLFDPDDQICVCKTLSSSSFCTLKEIEQGEFFIVNPISGGRSDKDVTKLRNLIFEIDNLSLKDQARIILKKIEMPYSTFLFSGKKSFHWIISLKEPLSSREMYDFLWKWIFNIIEIADPQTKNPARLTRYPGVSRPDTGREQKIFRVNGRIDNNQLMDWLEKHVDKCPKRINSPNPRLQSVQTDRASIIQLVDWYVYEYLGKEYTRKTTHVRCPVCAEDGEDKHGDNMGVTGDERLVHCFKHDDHDREIISALHRLRKLSKAI